MAFGLVETTTVWLRHNVRPQWIGRLGVIGVKLRDGPALADLYGEDIAQPL